MTKKVLIRLCGLQRTEPGAAPQEVEVVVPGEYFLGEDGTHTLVYDEIMEEFDGSVHNVMRFNEGLLCVTRTGVVEACMIFHPGQRKLTHYETPMGEMIVEVDTQDLTLSEENGSLALTVDYSLDLNYQPVSLNQIRIEASPLG